MLNKKLFEKLGFKETADLERFLARDDIKTIIGDNYDHYKEVWLEKFERKVNDVEKQEVKGRFNWLALLSYPIWAAYRKMYAQYFAFTGVMAALTLAETYYDFEISSGAFLGVMIYFAFVSKDMYFMDLVRHAQKLDKMPEAECEKYIALRAGTSRLYAWLALPVFLVVMIIAVVLGTILSGNPL